ncbi:DUF86 domain-containing protein [Caulobacter sp. BP25]|uniref:HepT-like ribonuclease domain-containing protein n=1 Tax=Caulobacter sp. BP25 TaxID=2048900 RepID=UPI000C12B707|nr:DUF86 domain-containing protein [Caulobacter sp. BP25]PHY21175.1 hypothetical protein CSW59_05310 [Caulobacter sp. BP25]
MPEASAVTYVAELLEAIGQIEAYVDGVDQAGFLADRMRRDAVAMNLLVIGESAGRLPAPIRDLEPNIDWRAVIDLRNRIAHGYSSISFSIVWSIVVVELPALRQAAERIAACL